MTDTSYSTLFQKHPNAFKDKLRAEVEEGLALSANDITREEVTHTQLWRSFQAFMA